MEHDLINNQRIEVRDCSWLHRPVESRSCFLRECPQDRRCVSLLDHDAESLAQELCRACVAGASRYATSNFLAQLHGRGTPGSKRFHCDRSERVVTVPGVFDKLGRCFASAASAADPAAVDERRRCDGASVSGHVKSHTRYFPRDHGSSVAPSGRLLSSRRSLQGSSSACTSVELSAWRITSLASACHP